jgi:hypothetical protein
MGWTGTPASAPDRRRRPGRQRRMVVPVATERPASSTRCTNSGKNPPSPVSCTRPHRPGPSTHPGTPIKQPIHRLLRRPLRTIRLRHAVHPVPRFPRSICTDNLIPLPALVGLVGAEGLPR